MTLNRALSVAMASALLLAVPAQLAAQTGPITKDMQTYCLADYKKFCGDYGLQTKALSNCMYRNGQGLSPACVKALVSAGQISQAQVDKLKSQAKGRVETAAAGK